MQSGNSAAPAPLEENFSDIWFILVWFSWVLWHINYCWLLMPNPFYTYKEFYLRRAYNKFPDFFSDGHFYW